MVNKIKIFSKKKIQISRSRASALNCDYVYLFDKDSSTPQWSYDADGAVYSADVSANGAYIITGTNDYIYLFNKGSSTPLWSWYYGERVDTVSISADGDYIAAGSADGIIHVFEKESSNPIWNYTASDNENEKVFIFNGWTFASDPTIAPFDHAIYDLQLVKCNKV